MKLRDKVKTDFLQIGSRITLLLLFIISTWLNGNFKNLILINFSSIVIASYQCIWSNGEKNFFVSILKLLTVKLRDYLNTAPIFLFLMIVLTIYHLFFLVKKKKKLLLMVFTTPPPDKRIKWSSRICWEKHEVIFFFIFFILFFFLIINLYVYWIGIRSNSSSPQESWNINQSTNFNVQKFTLLLFQWTKKKKNKGVDLMVYK